MSRPEIPLLRESVAFAARLVEAVRAGGGSRYHSQRRVNWSYRFDEDFYDTESEYFHADPDAYLAGRIPAATALRDVYALPLRRKALLTMLAKVLAHWLFRVLGGLVGRLTAPVPGKAGLRRYRKAYVDDIELVFDRDEPGVLRAVYPVPINLARQWRYLRTLQREQRAFRLAGNPYAPADLLRLLWRRDVRSMQRLESRAQVRHALEVCRLGITNVQLSDEFDIGSLDFTRTLVRHGVRVINNAHGVGKYFPVHAYPEFSVLTQRQVDYYHATRPCRYLWRNLNIKAPMAQAQATIRPDLAPGSGPDTTPVSLVFLSQVFIGISPLVAEAEARVVRHLAEALGSAEGVRLLYKPHPNNHLLAPPPGFAFLHRLEEVNGRTGTVFASFFSTCQIDPSFVGIKVLLCERLIYPAIAFDDTETVLDAAGLEGLVRSLVPQAPGTSADAPALPGGPSHNAAARAAVPQRSELQ
jgi:hypothetical protein